MKNGIAQAKASSLVQTHGADPAFGALTNAEEFDSQNDSKTFSDVMSHGGEAKHVITLLRMAHSDLHKELEQDTAVPDAVSQDAEQVALLQ